MPSHERSPYLAMLSQEAVDNYRTPSQGSGPGTYQVIASRTEVIASYEDSDYLPVVLKVYCLK